MGGAGGLPRPARSGLAAAVACALAALVAWTPTPSALAVFTKRVTVGANAVSTGTGFPICYRDAVTADNPVGYWRLDETSGTTAADSKGTNPGTYVNGPVLGQPGALPDAVNNRAASFDGVNDRVDVPASASLNVATRITIEAWIYPTDVASVHPIVEYADASNYGVHLWQYDAGNKLFANLTDTGGYGHYVMTPGPVFRTNTWYHVAVTYDGSLAVLYVNGTEVARAVLGAFTLRTNLPVNIGRRPVVGDSLQDAVFAGKLDEVAIYSTALTAAKIRTHYTTGRCYKDGVLADNPAGYWRLGETSGTTAADGIGGRHGRYTNGPTLNQPGALNGTSNPSVTFDGVNDDVSVPYTSTLNPSTFTLEAWAKPTGGQGTYRTVASSYVTTGPYGYGIWASPSNTWEAWIAGSGGAYTLISAPMTLNTWAHLVETYDGTTLRFYVDGLLAGSSAGAYARNTLVPLSFGGATYDGSTWQQFFPGSLDEVAVYTTALSQNRVQAHYLLGRSYQDTVLDSGPAHYWRLGDSSGTSAADSAGTDTGTYTNGPILAQPGLIAGDPDTATSFDGSDDLVTTASSISGPNVFSEEAWFRTTTTSGGKIIGFEDSNTATDGGNYDRMTYMANDGTLVFAVWPNAYMTIQSAAAYNDGAWHHVAATLGSGGMALYVDGVAVGTNPNTAAQGFSGYWRIGEGNLSTWSPTPSSYAFAGTIDDVAVYDRALTATEVQLHYDSGRQ